MAEFNAKQQLPGLLDWMRAQMKACGGKTAVIGISGGKDSSVTAALSVAAYGREADVRKADARKAGCVISAAGGAGICPLLLHTAIITKEGKGHAKNRNP